MAELHVNPEKGKSDKRSTRIDMTPMVDLAFLLLTFFMLTTTFNKPSTLEVNMPLPAPGEPPKVEHAMTLLVGEHNRLFYYTGNFMPGNETEVRKTDYSIHGLRKVLIEENRKVYELVSIIEQELLEGKIDEATYKRKISQVKKDRNNQGLFVFIKADDRASIENIVSIFDEMHICSVVNYVLKDISPGEKQYIASL